MTPDRFSVGRFLTGLVSIAALAYVAALAPRYLGFFRTQVGLEVLLATLLNLVLFASLGACALALTLVLRSWSQPGVRALALFLAGVATSWTVILGLFTFQVEDRSITAYHFSRDVPRGLLDVVLLVGALSLAVAAFLRFSALFPNRLSAADLEAREWGKPIHRLRVALLGPRPVWLLALAWPIVVIGTGVAGVLLAPHGTIEGFAAVPFVLIWASFPLAALSFGIQNLIQGYRRANENDRRRLLWLVAGVAMSAWLILMALPLSLALGLLAWTLSLPPPDYLPFVLWALAPGVLVSSVAVAIFYTGGVDPALVLRRSTVLGVMGTVWIALYAAAESWLSDWIAAALSLPGFVVSIAVALLAAGAALSFRNWASGLAARMPGADRRNAHWKAGRVPVGSEPDPGGQGDTPSSLE